MSDYRVKVTADTAQAQRQLGQLNDQVKTISDSFTGLRNVIAGIALGNIIQGAIQFADAVIDIKDATDISTKSIVDFSRAVEASGGSVDGAQKGLLKLVSSIEEAGERSGDTREAFYKLGLNLKDLRTLSNQEILRRVVDGLGQITDVGEQARIKTLLLGKEFRTVSGAALAQNFGQASTSGDRLATAMQTAADAQGQLEFAMRELQSAIVIAIQPLTEFIKNIDTKTITAFVTTIVELGKALLALFVITKISQTITQFGLIMTSAGKQGKDFFRSIGSVDQAAQGIKTIKREISELPNVFNRAMRPGDFPGKLDVGFKMLGNSIFQMTAGFLRFLPVIGQVIAALILLDGAILAITGKNFQTWVDRAELSLDRFAKKLRETGRIGPIIGSLLPSGALSQADSDKQQAAEILRRNRQIQDSLAQQNRERQYQLDLEQKINSEAAKYAQTSNQNLLAYSRGLIAQEDSFNFQSRLVGASQNQREQLELMNGLQQEFNRRQLDTINEIAKLRLERSLLKDSDEEQNGILTRRIDILMGQLNTEQEIFNRKRDQVTAALQGLQTARDEYAARLALTKLGVEQLRLQRQYQQTLGDARRQSNFLELDLAFQERRNELQLVENGLGQNAIELAEALNQETRRYLQLRDQLGERQTEIAGLINDEERLQADLQDADLRASQDKIILLQQEYDQLTNLANEYLRIFRSNERLIIDSITRQQEMRFNEQQRLREIELSTSALERQYRSVEALEEITRKIQDRKLEIKFDQSLKGMAPIRRQLREITENARRSGLEAGRAFAATFDEDEPSPERLEQLAEGLRKITESYQQIGQEQIRQLGFSQEYIDGNMTLIGEYLEEVRVGFRDTFDKFKSDATDTSKDVGSVFSTFTRSFEDAFVRMAQTGKISFRDLANSVIADIIRIAARRMLLQGMMLFGFGGTGFNAASAAETQFMLPGRANGGLVTPNRSYVVGERGPELFRPAMAGSIIPNNQFQEMGGGGSVVTYNINAVDAASFRAMVARDPSFIHAVAERGRNSQPSRRA